MKYGRKANLSTESRCDISEEITTEIVPNAKKKKKKCSKRKKLLEIREVGKTLPTYLWKALST